MHAPYVLGCASEVERISSITVEVPFVATNDRTPCTPHGRQHDYFRRAGNVTAA